MTAEAEINERLDRIIELLELIEGHKIIGLLEEIEEYTDNINAQLAEKGE